MNRMLFLTAVVVIFEILTFFTVKGLYWFVRPWFAGSQKVVMIASFIISNAFLLALLFGQFRITLGYLAVLWLLVLAMILTLLVGIVIGKFGTDSLVGLRIFGVLSFVSLLGLGLFNAYMPVVRHSSIVIDKPMGKVRLAVASDLHLGALVGNRELSLLADIVQREQVDLLLMPGDIMDDDVAVYHAKKMQNTLQQVAQASKYGAIASLGNHDLYRDAARLPIVNAIEQAGIVLLDDKSTVVQIDNRTQLNIVGRFDDHQSTRKSTAELLKDSRTDLPTILLDHRPSQIDENSQLPIDLQVSGHTHNGQIFPANFIVKALNRVGYGQDKIANMHVVVSSGYGFWGIPFRLGSRAEVWIIDVVGQNPSD